MPAPPPPFPDPAVLGWVLRHPETLTPADLPHVQASGQGGAVYFALSAEHPLRPFLRQYMLDLALRHAQIRAELRPLLTAWAAEGIPALLFKGFALAEFEYRNPAERFYGDVDVLLPADLPTVTRAVHIALAHGWRSDGQHADPDLWTHETAHLYSSGGAVRLDVHRFAVSFTDGLGQKRAEALTAGLWQRATQYDWGGVPVWRPSPLDAAVLNLALNRTWGGDMGGIKPADYADLRQLMARHNLSFVALAEHAAQLGAEATWAAFLSQCNPARGCLELDVSRSAPLLSQAARQDGLQPHLLLWAQRLRSLGRILPLLPTALLDVLWAGWAVRRGGDPRTYLNRWTPAAPVRRLPLRQLGLRLVAISWLTRLFYPRQRQLGVCVPRAYATYRILRRAGHPAVFVSGVARRGGAVLGHAWVEDDRGNIEAYGEPSNRQRFKVLLQFPAPPEP